MIGLASRSPRRRELLEQIGVDCRVVAVEVSERRQPDEAPAVYVCRVARDKARAGAHVLAGSLPVLAADTIVVAGSQVLGKPDGAGQARGMLERLSGRTHEVLSAVALAWDGRLEHRLSRSRVRFRRLEPAEIDAYWATGEPADKAGAYAIQGLGALFVTHLSGSYSGVVGLPLRETAELLGLAGIQVFRPVRQGC